MTKQTTQKFTAHGKFLITGEYVVLDYVPALAIPLKVDQHLEIHSRNDKNGSWKSYDVDGSLWFQADFKVEQLLDDNHQSFTSHVEEKLFELLRYAIQLNSSAAEKLSQGFDAITTLDFNRTYGMGTSSTLVSLIAQWLECDPYALQFSCFGGSGYDIACATANQALIYKYHEILPEVQSVDWVPAINDQLFFVYLNRKQNSRESIARFDKTLITPSLREELVTMPQQFIHASNDLNAFEAIVKRHEAILGALIDLEPVQSRLFPNYSGAIKSLGGWGGDFMMCTGGAEERSYFKARGYDIVLEWDEVIL